MSREVQGLSTDDVRSARRRRISAVAERLFYERGFRGTTLDAIAEAMKISKPFVYGAYERKTEILYDIYRGIVLRALETLAAARALDHSRALQLESFARLLAMVTIENQAGVGVFFREEASMEPEHLRAINDLKRTLDEGIAAMISEGVERGEFEVADAKVAALAVGGMISWTYVWFRRGGRLDAAAIAEHMAEYALRIVGARRPE